MDSIPSIKYLRENPMQYVNTLEKQTNQTYIVPIATIGFQNYTNYDTIQLNIIQCSNTDLEEYQCLDFSTLSQKYLKVNTKQKQFSVISILFYSCQVTDNIKTFVPDNCAKQSDIDDMVDGAYTLLHLRLFTQQYNTTSKQNQINFKNYMMFPQSNQYFLNTQNMQNQITKVRDGFVIQSESEYSAPIQYSVQNQAFPNIDNPYIQVNLQIDEVIQYTSIQFSTFPQILALVNSAFSLLMLLGFICRRFANKSILQDFFCIFLQNMHQNLYEEVLKQNKLFEQKANSTEIETKLNKLHIGQEMTDKEGANIFNIPQFITKSRDYVEQSQQSQLNNIQLSQQDEILQTEVEEEEKKSPRLDQLNTYNKCQQYDDREQRTNQNQIKVEQNQDNILFTTDTNEIIKTSNETEQNIIKASPQMQFCQNRNESYQMYTDRPLNEINKIPQSASIYKGNETQRINSIFQKDITLLFTDRQIEQPNLIGQDQQKQQNCLKTVAQVNNTNQNSNKNSSTIEYYIQKLKTIQDISIFKRFTKINFGYRFTLQKINCFKKNSTEEENERTHTYTMLCSKLDLFSQPFLFKLNNNQLKKGTVQGVVTSLGIFVIILAYFVYLTMQYFGNKFDPVFRSQSFVTNDLIEIPLREDLIAFQLIQSPGKTVEQYQKQMNLTYVVPMATIGFQNNTHYDNLYLKVIECSDPYLQGYHCLDFSNLTTKSLIVNTNQKLFSVISIYIYSCQVIDNIKTFAPDNCANQTDIDDFIDGIYTQLHLRLFTQQYNTTSKQVQVNFKNYMMFPQSNQYILNTQNVQNQITKVRDGFVIQEESKYSAPIQYVFENQSFPNEDNPYIQVNLQIDEVIQYTSIQFSTFPEILALVNSAFSLLILMGFFCKSFANKSILQDFFCVFLQNMHQNLYEEVLKQNKLFEQKAATTQIETKVNKLNIGQEITEKEVANNINIPQFITKSRIQIEQNIQTQINNTLNNIQEEISKSEDDKKTNEDNQLSKIKKYQQQLNNKKINNQNQKLSEDVFQYNNTIITSASNDIKNSNDSYQDDILKTSPRTQLSTLKTEQSEIQTHRPLILLSKIPQSASIVQRSDRQTNSSESQKDVMICLTQNQIQQSNQTSQQNKQKLQDNQKPKLDKKDMLSTPKRQRDNTYFEKQLDIFDSTELSCQYIKKFIQKCNSSKILDKVDKRILSSINKNSYNLY
ncbi:hypothetical protein ABPG74_005365 [Tetrahymena malaccensis]